MSTIHRRVLAGLVTLMFCLFAVNVFSADSAAKSKEKSSAEAVAKTPRAKKTTAQDGAEEIKAAMEKQQQVIEAMNNAIEQMRAQMKSQEDEILRLKSADQVASLKPVLPSIAATTAAFGATSPLAGMEKGGTSVASSLQASEDSPSQKKEPKLSDLTYGKIKLGATFFGDWSYYTQTGFGPQFITQANQPGPGNDGFNSFDVTRTYLNFFYTPTDAVTLRITPNIYRQVDVSKAQAFGNGAAINTNSNGNLGFRLKYAYVDFNTLFSGSDMFGKDKLTAGQTMNPLVDWEEGLSGFRFAYLTPWNYLSLSSTYTGIKLHGPIMINGREYLDYDIGVFNTASFHAIESNDKKQVMARVTWYPFGTKVDRTGFGLTAFEDYGYNTQTPDTRSIALNRLALFAHYQSPAKTYEIVGEYDLGRNAFNTGNLFSGSGPADEFGLGPTSNATFDAIAKGLLGGDHTRQQGFDFFGNVKLGSSPFRLFGLFQYFQPNTNISGTNPLDFTHTVAGISYHFNNHFDIAVGDSNLHYVHNQFTMSASQIAPFSSSLAAANPLGIENVVPKGTNAIMIVTQFNY